MRYRLRTLLIALGILPPLLAGGWWGDGKWREAREQQARLSEFQGFPPFITIAPEEILLNPGLSAEDRARLDQRLLDMEGETPPPASENSN